VKIYDYLDSRLDIKHRFASDELVATCPKCGRQGKLYINPDKGVFFCFRCEFGRNKRLHHLLAELENIDIEEAKQRVERLLKQFAKQNNLAGAREAVLDILLQHTKKEKEAEQHLALPFGCVPINSPLAFPARAYLKQRGFTPKHWERFELLFCAGAHDDKGQRVREYGHIIFVERLNGEVSYYTTRTISKGTVKAKSLNPTGVKKHVLFGTSALRQKARAETVILVEGPLDTVSLSGHAIGAFGSSLTRFQLEALSKSGIHSICVAFDYDAIKKAVHAAFLIQQYAPGCNVFIFTPSRDEGDPADNVGLRISNNVNRILSRAEPLALKHKMLI